MTPQLNASLPSAQGDVPGGGDPIPNPPPPTPPPAPTPVDGDGSIKLDICGPLDVNNLVWPTALGAVEVKAFGLSLNITGSFEGTKGWQNLANNFDGQGMSLGLLQQNLGQSTLQPLFEKMRQNHKTDWTALFTPAQLKSIHGMLDAFSPKVAAVQAKGTENENELFPEGSISPLDLDADEGGAVNKPISEDFDKAGAAGSIEWAVSNLYQSSGKFKSEWGTAFLALAATPSYRSLQLSAALPIFNRAKGYFVAFKFTEMRMMLLMFDFVTQNGGFTASQKTSYEAFVAQNPTATETARAMQLLSIRLKSVNPKYVEDVRARKSTIINGTGTVHGSKRSLAKENCYDPKQKL